jgi:RNA 2',3'-cyclic 3'-phosphodiesterase
VTGDERLRLFCALRLPAGAVSRIASWQHDQLRGGRIVPAENLHLTLAFLGHRPAGDVEAVAAALRSAVAGAGTIVLRVRSYRETRSVGMLALDDEELRATGLAGRLHEHLESLGLYRSEARPWLPHLTVLRFRTRPKLRPPLPELGPLTPSDAAVYLSRLRSGGAQYEVLESVALGGG